MGRCFSLLWAHCPVFAFLAESVAIFWLRYHLLLAKWERLPERFVQRLFVSFAVVSHSLDYLGDMRAAVQMRSTEAKTLTHRKRISPLIRDALYLKKMFGLFFLSPGRACFTRWMPSNTRFACFACSFRCISNAFLDALCRMMLLLSGMCNTPGNSGHCLNQECLF